ncbi:MAG: hypothetical protein GTO13_07250 [Proteobacteria bacterium]|nr:hypothetical protein [Pseudomonadota bacterium]
MKVRGRAIFALVLLFLFLGGFFLCTGWSIEARLFPLLIVVVGTGLSVCLLFLEMGRGGSPETEEGKPKKDDPAAAYKPTKPRTTPRSEAIMMLWVSGFLSIILVFGFWVAIAAFVPLFMCLFGRENRKTVAIYTVGIWLAIYLIFAVGMKVPLYGGILGFSW